MTDRDRAIIMGSFGVFWIVISLGLLFGLGGEYWGTGVALLFIGTASLSAAVWTI